MPLLLAICPLLHELSYCPLLYALCPAHLPSALPHCLLPCLSPDLLPSATSRLHAALALSVVGIEPTAWSFMPKRPPLVESHQVCPLLLSLFALCPGLLPTAPVCANRSLLPLALCPLPSAPCRLPHTLYKRAHL